MTSTTASLIRTPCRPSIGCSVVHALEIVGHVLHLGRTLAGGGWFFVVADQYGLAGLRYVDPSLALLAPQHLIRATQEDEPRAPDMHAWGEKRLKWLEHRLPRVIVLLTVTSGVGG